VTDSPKKEKRGFQKKKKEIEGGMTDEDQIAAFGEELERMVDRFREEFDLPYVSVVGVLTMMATQLTLESLEEGGEFGE
jgi:hypothetical protein